MRLYAQDAITAASGRRNVDGGQALRDLRSTDQRLLRTLCTPLGADPEAVARAIEKCIARGYGAGIQSRPQKRKLQKDVA